MRSWQTRDGLPNNGVGAMLQTPDGYLWLAGDGGLARFDGVSFTVFDASTTAEIHSHKASSLFEDAGGNLWIGFADGELIRYRDGCFCSTKFRAPWARKTIGTIAEGSSNEIWVLSMDGKLAGLDGKAVATPDGADVTALTSSPRGTVWVASGTGVYTLDGGRLTSLAVGGSPDERVADICAGRDGSLWILSQTRLRQWKKGRIYDAGNNPLGQSKVQTMIEIRSGGLAVGTVNDGLFLIFPGRGVMHFNHANGFRDNWVRSLCEDREGTLWIAVGSRGLVELRPSRVLTLKPPDDWQGAGVRSVTRSHDGALWIGTEGAGLYRFYTNDWTHFGNANGLDNLFVLSVSEDSQNRLWLGTWGDGVFIKDGDRFVSVGLTGANVKASAILHGKNGVTWIGTATGLLRYQNGTLTRFGEKEGLFLPDVRALAEAADGTLWFGMMGGGLGRLQNGMIKQFRKLDGLSSDFVQCLHLDTDGVLWVGTDGGGLARFAHGRFSEVGVRQGLPDNCICAIEQDDSNNFWISSHAGIFRIPKSGLNRCANGQIPAVHPLIYGIGVGMPTPECSGGFQPAGFKSGDGQIWFSTSEGLVAINPNHINVNQLPPPVLIERLLVDDLPVNGIRHPNEPVRIAPGRHRFEFDYTGLSFVDPGLVDFKYRFEGLEQDWIDVGTKRTVTYGYIPPGGYRFQVTACNNDGVWNATGATLAFTVLPHFWQTWWFDLGAGVTAVVSLSGGALWVGRRRLRRKLERAEHQRALEHERTRIARDIHDSVGADLTRISLLSQSVQGELDNPDQAGTRLNQIYDTARELTRAMDEIVWAVNPEHDTLDSLANYLGKFAQDFLGPLGIRCRLDWAEQLPPWLIVAHVRHHLFLAFKEVLNNVAKHAAATEVSVSLATARDAFTLAMRDNGRGLAPDSLSFKCRHETRRLASGYGLINMRAHLEIIGGHCQIQSLPDGGTEVKFIVPVSSNNFFTRKRPRDEFPRGVPKIVTRLFRRKGQA
jgi:ligand-binding sensor domain-containing protein/signal transduction histidine kinase